MRVVSTSLYMRALSVLYGRKTLTEHTRGETYVCLEAAVLLLALCERSTSSVTVYQ